MASYAEMERFGLTLPEVVLQAHMGQPSLRARGRMFALWSEADKTTIMKLEREHQHMLFELRPDTFQPCKVGTGTWSYVDVGKLTSEELHKLVVEAWRQVVPKALATSTSAAGSPPARPRRAAAATAARPLSSRARPRRR